MEVKPQVLWCSGVLTLVISMDTSAPKSYWGRASCQDCMTQEKFGNPPKVMACWMVNQDSSLITECWQRCIMITGMECFWMVQFKVFLAVVLDFFHGAQQSCSHLVLGGWRKWDLRIAGWYHSSGRTGVWGKKSLAVQEWNCPVPKAVLPVTWCRWWRYILEGEVTVWPPGLPITQICNYDNNSQFFLRV